MVSRIAPTWSSSCASRLYRLTMRSQAQGGWSLGAETDGKGPWHPCPDSGTLQSRFLVRRTSRSSLNWTKRLVCVRAEPAMAWGRLGKTGGRGQREERQGVPTRGSAWEPTASAALDNMTEDGKPKMSGLLTPKPEMSIYFRGSESSAFLWTVTHELHKDSLS